MPNRVQVLFGIQYPIIQAGMVWCSGWKLASAVSNAGGLGLIGAGSMSAEILQEHIRRCKQATDKPFGVNLPLLYAGIEQQIEVLQQEGVKIVFTSAGNPKLYTPRLKDMGMTVVHVVSSIKFALKAQESGVDAIVAEGFEAGGHNGREETTTLCLVPAVVQTVSIPVIAAGGIASGRAMVAAMVLGAEGVQVGSRFAVCEESSAHQAYKQAVWQAKEGDTVLTLKTLTPVRLIRNEFCERVRLAEAAGATVEELKQLLGKGRARKGIFEGDLQEGELEIGQVSMLLNHPEKASAIVESIWQEFCDVKKQLANTDI